jgi:hypothetical protein
MRIFGYLGILIVLAFGTSADGDRCGRDGVCSSGGTRWNAIRPRWTGRGFTEYLGLAFS